MNTYNKNPFEAIASYHNSCLDYLINNAPPSDQVTWNDWADLFSQYKSDVFNNQSDAFLVESKTNFFTTISTLTNFSKDEWMRTTPWSDSTMKIYNQMISFGGNMNDFPNYILQLQSDIISGELSIRDKTEVLCFLAISYKSSVYWLNVANSPSNKWNDGYLSDQINDFPKLVNVVSADAFCGGLGAMSEYGIGSAYYWITGDRGDPGVGVGFFIGAAIGSLFAAL